MSHAPEKSSAPEAKRDYLARWNVLVQLLKQGRSFSGRERNCCFLNTGGARFADASAVTGFDFPEDSRAVLPVDWDFDGDLDLWVLNRTAPRIRLLKNESAGQGRFLAVRLHGTQGNRDAIGARVEVTLGGGAGVKLIQSLRAGDGFLSQRSTWLHFGLGAAADISNLKVRWPGGGVQEFQGVEANSFVELTEGDAEVRTWRPPAGGLNFAAATPKLPDLPSAIRISLGPGVPVPDLRYITPDRKWTKQSYEASEFTLINLWATWCAPCLKELREFALHADDLKRKGIRIVALNVDGLRDSNTADEQAANSLLDQLGFGGERGFATDAFVSRLELIQTPLVETGPGFVMPTSFLVTKSGELAAIYQGPISLPQLESDTSLAREHLTGALFPGRRLHEPNYGEYLTRVGDALLEGGHPVDAFKFLRQADRSMPSQPYIMDRLEKVSALIREADGNAQRLRGAVRHRPDDVNAEAQLGVAYQTLGEYDAAARHLARALALEPNYYQARTALGAALAALGEFEAAEREFRRVLEVVPNDAQALQNIQLLDSKRLSAPEPKEKTD